MSHTIPQPSQLAFWVLNSQNWEKSGQKWPKNRHFGVYFGGLTLPGPTMRIQMGVNWSQATGILSHTIPQLSQLALWVLNSQNREKSGQKWPKNRHFGGSMLSGPLMCIHYVRLQCWCIFLTANIGFATVAKVINVFLFLQNLQKWWMFYRFCELCRSGMPRQGSVRIYAIKMYVFAPGRVVK